MRFRFHYLALPFAALLVASGCKSNSSQKPPSEQATAKASEPEGPSAQELFVQGNEHLDAGDWDEAIEAYESALERDSERWDIWLNLAIAYSKSRDTENALDAIEKSLANGGEGRPEVYYNLGNIYQRRGFYRQALKAYRTELAHSDEPRVETLINIGATLAIMDRPKDALATYERAQKLAPQDPRIQHGIAVSLYLQQKHEASVDAFRKLNSMAPNYARAYFDMAKPLVNLERLRDAIQVLETYLEKAPDGDFRKTAEEQIEVYREELGSSDRESPQ